MQSVSRSPVPVSSKFNICIPGRTEILVNCHLPKSHRQQLGMTCPLDNADSPSCLFAAYTVCQAEDREIVVRLMNTSHVDIEIQAGQKVSSFCPLVETYAPHSFQESKQQLTATCCTDNDSQLASQLAEQIDPSLPAHAKATILNTLLHSLIFLMKVLATLLLLSTIVIPVLLHLYGNILGAYLMHIGRKLNLK